jgi:hypothetical protein
MALPFFSPALSRLSCFHRWGLLFVFSKYFLAFTEVLEKILREVTRQMASPR